VGSALFRIEDSFIASTCYGWNDDHVKAFFVYGLEMGREEMEQAVQAGLINSEFADYIFDFAVGFQEMSYVVVPPEEIEDVVWEREYGDLDSPPAPIVAQAVQQASNYVAAIITENLEWL
jgi:hypothetical protein